MTDYVFGYASLVALSGPDSLPGCLHGYRRHWGVAMDNWEGGEEVKHFLDRETGERPRIRVAYLDLYEYEGSAVNGLALPVDAERLTALDAREVNYERVDATEAFESLPVAAGRSPAAAAARVFTYVGLSAARERCRRGVLESNAFAAADYVATVRQAFERLAPGALAEFDQTTDPLPFPERDLQVVPPGPIAGFSPR